MDADGQGTGAELRPSALRAAGVSERRGLARAGGQPAAYRRILGLFRRLHGDDGPMLARALHGGDYVTAAAVLHKLRGSAVTIGAATLARRARQLGSALALRGAAPAPARSLAPAPAPGDALDALLGALGTVLSALDEATADRGAAGGAGPAR